MTQTVMGFATSLRLLVVLIHQTRDTTRWLQIPIQMPVLVGGCNVVACNYDADADFLAVGLCDFASLCRLHGSQCVQL